MLGLSDSFGILDTVPGTLDVTEGTELEAVVPLTGCLGGEVLAVETGSWDLCLEGDFSLK